MPRKNGRTNDDLRPVTMTRGISKYAEGSCLIEVGDTRIHCTASVDDRVPMWLRNSGQGWVTADYGMLPRATAERTVREATRAQRRGRSMEIERLIGRSLRAVVDLHALGERTIQIDCDVLQADGGTRTAAVTGAYIALAEASNHLRENKLIRRWPLRDQVAAVSVGLVGGEMLLDLSYEEDSQASVDMNIVMTADGRIVEVQATAEGAPFAVTQLGKLIAIAQKGIKELLVYQHQALGDIGG